MKELLDLLRRNNVRKIAVHTNKDNARNFGQLVHLSNRYPSAGVHAFFHGHYDAFKCMGPYIPKWKGRNVMWHPSRLGHQLRAAHISFFWLSILSDVLNNITSAISTAAKGSNVQSDSSALLNYKEELCRRINHSSNNCAASIIMKGKNDVKLNITDIIPRFHHDTNVSDGVRCYTEYKPRPESMLIKTSLKSLVVSDNVFPPLRDASIIQSSSRGWAEIVFEYIFMPNLANHSSAMGYLDYKVILYGNNNSRPLVLYITINSPGKIFLCDVPYVPPKWQTLLHEKLSLSNVTLFIKRESNLKPDFIAKTKKVSFNRIDFAEVKYFSHHNDERCIQSHSIFSPGNYYFSIVPTTEKHVIISTLILP